MQLSWDDFRLVKAVADRGSLASAARTLGVNHSTAFRRLAAIEGALGTRLFERLRSGYRPTDAGAEMVETAARMEGDVARFDRVVAGQAATLSGQLRITAPASFVNGLLMPMLGSFRARYPAITLDLVVAEEPLNLSRRDADVAIRASANPPDNLFGRRLSGIAWAIYGRRDRSYPDLDAGPWICLSPEVGGGGFARYLAERATPGAIVLQMNAVIGLCEAVEAGIGVAALPCYLGDAHPALVRLREPEPELAAGLWSLTHPDLRHSARVRALMDHIAEAITPYRAALEGRREGDASG